MIADSTVSQENANVVSMKGFAKFDQGRVNSFIAWALTSAVVAALGSSAKGKEIGYDRDFAPEVYKIGMFTFFWVSLFSLFSYLGSENSSKSALTKATTIMNFVVFGMYFSSYFELTPTFRDLNGYPVDLCRFVEYFFDMESISCIIGFVSQADSPMVDRAVINVWLLTIFGFIGSITKGSISQWVLLLAYSCHSIAVQAMWDMYKQAINGEKPCHVDESMMEFSQTLTVYSMHGFALTHALVRFEFVSFAQGEALYLLSTVFSKIPLTLIFNTAPVGVAGRKKVASEDIPLVTK